MLPKSLKLVAHKILKTCVSQNPENLLLTKFLKKLVSHKILKTCCSQGFNLPATRVRSGGPPRAAIVRTNDIFRVRRDQHTGIISDSKVAIRICTSLSAAHLQPRVWREEQQERKTPITALNWTKAIIGWNHPEIMSIQI